MMIMICFTYLQQNYLLGKQAQELIATINSSMQSVFFEAYQKMNDLISDKIKMKKVFYVWGL